MAQATHSHSWKLHPGGNGDFSRNVRADFSRGFLASGARIPESLAAASSSRRSLASRNVLSTLLARSCDQSLAEMRQIDKLRAGLRSIDLRVAAIRAPA